MALIDGVCLAGCVRKNWQLLLLTAQKRILNLMLSFHSSIKIRGFMGICNKGVCVKILHFFLKRGEVDMYFADKCC